MQTVGHVSQDNLYTVVMKCEHEELMKTMREVVDYHRDNNLTIVEPADIEFIVKAAEMLVLYPDMETLVAVMSKLPDNKLTVTLLDSYVELCKLMRLDAENEVIIHYTRSGTSGYCAVLSTIEELVDKQNNLTQEMLTPAMLHVALDIAKHKLYTPALRLLVTTLSEMYGLRERTGLNKLSSRELVPYLTIRYMEYCLGTENELFGNSFKSSQEVQSPLNIRIDGLADSDALADNPQVCAFLLMALILLPHIRVW